MPVFKYVGFLLTLEQAAIIASNIAKKDLTDISKTVTMANVISAVSWTLGKRFPRCMLWPTSCPRGSLKEEDGRLLIVCHAYNHPHESLENYTEVPATKRDAKVLAWLKTNGMDMHQMLKQWTTLPNPQIDDPDWRIDDSV